MTADKLCRVSEACEETCHVSFLGGLKGFEDGREGYQFKIASHGHQLSFTSIRAMKGGVGVRLGSRITYGCFTLVPSGHF